MPTRERSQKEEAKESKDDGNDTVRAELARFKPLRTMVVCTYINQGKTTEFLKVLATQIKFMGSLSMLICSARRVALLEQR